MPHTRFTEDVKQQAVDLVLHSQLAVADAARQIGCSIHSIHAWIKKHRQQQNFVTKSPTTFVPVTLVDPKATSVEIVTPNGYIVRLDSVSLAELLAAIAAC